LMHVWTIEGFKKVTVTRWWVCIIAISYVLFVINMLHM
jgi:hypothetical protein